MVLSGFFSKFRDFLETNLGSGPGEVFFFEEVRGSGVLDPCSWSGVSQV